MSKVNGVGFKFSDFVKVIGKTIKEDIDHSHRFEVDYNGNGYTTKIEPKTYKKHVHKIINKKIEESLNHKHIM